MEKSTEAIALGLIRYAQVISPIPVTISFLTISDAYLTALALPCLQSIGSIISKCLRGRSPMATSLK